MKVNDPVLAPFTADEIAAARKLAASRSASVVAILEEQAGLPPEAFTERLAATLHYPVANIESLHRWQPAFDLLPFAEALRGQVILFRDEQERLRLVFGDPFASDRLAWADERIGAQFELTLAHHADVAAYLVGRHPRIMKFDVVPSSQLAPVVDRRNPQARGGACLGQLGGSALPRDLDQEIQGLSVAIIDAGDDTC